MPVEPSSHIHLSEALAAAASPWGPPVRPPYATIRTNRLGSRCLNTQRPQAIKKVKKQYETTQISGIRIVVPMPYAVRDVQKCAH